MARRPMTPARRKRRTIRMAIALPILLAVLVLVLDYPILTAGQAPGHPEAVLLRPRGSAHLHRLFTRLQ